MAQIERLHGNVKPDSNIVVDALCPGSACDAHETALWIQNLLQTIYGEVCKIVLLQILQLKFLYSTIPTVSQPTRDLYGNGYSGLI